MTDLHRNWSHALLAGLLIAAIQVAVFLLILLVSVALPGPPGSGVFVAGLFLLVLLAPVLGWVVAERVFGGVTHPLRAWPVAFVNLLLLLSAHGFEDAGLPLWTAVAALGVATCVFGALSFLARPANPSS